MIVDPHNHVLGTALPPGHERFIKEMRTPGLRTTGRLPIDRPATDEDWAGLGDVTAPVSAQRLVDDHLAAGVDKATVLAVAPSDYTAYGQRGTVDLGRETDVDGPLSIDLGNDYIASLTRQHPELLGMAAVNPRHRGVEAARAELGRAIGELGLTGLKLYPMYDHYAIDDRDLAFPVLEAARDLDIGVMVHMGTSSARDADLELGRPLAVDAAARAFPDLPLLICHAGYPWVEECLAVLARHEHVYLDVSYFLRRLTQAELLDFLLRAKRTGVPWSRICWATDYPGGGPPAQLLPLFALVGDLAEPGTVTAADMARFLGGNWCRFAGLDWSLEETVAQLEEREPLWRRLAAGG